MRFISANKIFDGQTFLSPGTVLVLDDKGRLADVVSGVALERGEVQHFDGLLTPGFINAHCHLELSHLKNEIPRHTGLPAFGKQVIVQRDQTSVEEKLEHMRAADKEMRDNGTVAVGDIGNGVESYAVKAASGLFYHNFIELIGLRPEHADTIFQNGQRLLEISSQYQLRASLAPHAPYSTSKELIRRIAAFDAEQGLPFSIHNQESEEEGKFFRGEECGFHDLFRFLNLDISWFRAPGTSSLRYYAETLSSVPSLLVHNTCTGPEDVRLLAQKNIYWCFCPRANLYIENKLPNWRVFEGEKDRICLGTDSLAGNTGLDLVAEANVLLADSAMFSVEDVLRALTGNAAKALQIADRFGVLVRGRNVGLNWLRQEGNLLHFNKKIA